MTRAVGRNAHMALGFAAAVLAPVAASALTVEFPGPAVQTGARAEALTSYRLPIGPYSDGTIPTRRVEGALEQMAWRIDVAGLTTLQILQPLRDRALAEGYELLFECGAVACGGFDFRYGTDVLPEPQMHVDLGDFRYLAALRNGPQGAEVFSLLVSRSADQAFVQLTQITPGTAPAPAVTVKPAQPEPAPQSPGTLAPTAESGDFGAQIQVGGVVVLDDLVFASGAAELVQGDYPSLVAMADWLKADPSRKVALVGHTDASGGLDANLALSRQRAAAVRSRLIDGFGVAGGQLIAQGVGYLSPRATNLTEEGRMLNRRVEAVLLSE